MKIEFGKAAREVIEIYENDVEDRHFYILHHG